MKISNVQGIIIGSCLAVIGIGVQQMGFIHPGTLILIGAEGILIVIFYKQRQDRKDKQKQDQKDKHTWLTGQDAMRVYSLSDHQLLQFIDQGLPTYHPDTDISIQNEVKPEPMAQHEAKWFLAIGPKTYGYEDMPHRLNKVLFRVFDLKRYV